MRIRVFRGYLISKRRLAHFTNWSMIGGIKADRNLKKTNMELEILVQSKREQLLDIYVLIEFIYNNMFLFIVYLSFRMCMSPWFVRIILDTGLWIDLHCAFFFTFLSSVHNFRYFKQ
jgi:hypothetical protein